jgi:hypothetical protein
MKLEDRELNPDDPVLLKAEMEKIFKDHFLANLGGSPPIVRSESEDCLSASIYCAYCYPVGMHKHGQRCTDLVETTANALSSDAVALMLLTVQKDNMELNINRAVTW